jgi:hypothetical protein
MFVMVTTSFPGRRLSTARPYVRAMPHVGIFPFLSGAGVLLVSEVPESRPPPSAANPAARQFDLLVGHREQGFGQADEPGVAQDGGCFAGAQQVVRVT